MLIRNIPAGFLKNAVMLSALALLSGGCPETSTADPTPESDAGIPDSGLDAPDGGTGDGDSATNDLSTDLGDELPLDTPAATDTPLDIAPDSNEDTTTDAPNPDAGDASGGQDAEDGGSDDTSPTDACGDACASDQICAPGGNCVATCAATSPDFDPTAVFNALSPGWDVVGMHCGGSLAINAFEPLSATEVLELVGTDGAPDATLRVDKVTFGTEVTTANMSSSTIAGSIADFTVFPGLRLKADGAQENFGYGYTGSFDVTQLFSPGEVLFGSLTNPGNPEAIEGSSNYDLAWLSDSQWLVASRSVNSIGSSTGVYWLDRAQSNKVVRVVEGLGFASGNVAVHDQVILVGGYADPWDDTCPSGPASGGAGNKVFFTTVSAVQAAATAEQPLNAYCEAQEISEIASDFSFLDDGSVISVNTFEQKLLTHHVVSVDDSGVLGVTESTPIAVDNTLSLAKGVPGSGGQVMIKTEAGYMLIAPAP